jgi:hypothetical protein
VFDIYAYVYAQLRATDLKVHQIAAGSGVPMTTIRGIKDAITTNPRIDTLKALAGYFERLEKDKK